MSASPIVVPVKRGMLQCTLTPPWFVDQAEYAPNDASFRLLINGEEAFRAVHEAIAAARNSVCIICWGFQPSMYFIRDGRSPCIGELLEQKAREGVVIRLLCWAYRGGGATDGANLNVTGATVGESNTPGRGDWLNRWGDRPPSSTDDQYDYDVSWYGRYDENQEPMDVAIKDVKAWIGHKQTENLQFRDRGFSNSDRKTIADQRYDDRQLSLSTQLILAAFPSHHQKMVLVDYDDPKTAVGFVMGHNMLDGYWDTSEHKSRPRTLYRSGLPDPHPNRVANGLHPLHDYSCRLTGPILGDLFANFSLAWEKRHAEMGRKPEKLLRGNFAKYAVRKDTDDDRYIMGQILRTQPQYKKEDIKNCYLQAVNNASQYIHIENQYFRWPPLAEKIKACADGQGACGRKPETHGFLYLFVITNSTDAGVGAGTVNTYRMLDSLGRADAIPGVARQERAEDINAELGKATLERRRLESDKAALDSKARLLQGSPAGAAAMTRTYETLNTKLADAKAREDALKQQATTLQQNDTVIPPEDRPGLKTHICTLVSPDTKKGETWVEVYIHAKLMLIDDAFMTLGSANINTRSMEVDSELNIAHHRPEITKPVRAKLWGRYTNGASGQEELGRKGMERAYKQWAEILEMNIKLRKVQAPPIAPLAAFLRTSPERTDKD